MEKAKKLLIESRMNVDEISTICGYENQGKFGAAFKAYRVLHRWNTDGCIRMKIGNKSCVNRFYL